MNTPTAVDAVVTALAPEVLDLEVLALTTDLTRTTCSAAEVNSEVSLDDWAFGLRALRADGLSAAATSSADPDDVIQAARRAFTVASPSPLRDFAATPATPATTAEDPALTQLLRQPGQVRRLAAALLASTQALAPGRSVEVQVGVQRTRRALRTLAGGAGQTATNTSLVLTAWAGLDHEIYEVSSFATLPDEAELLTLGQRLVASSPPATTRLPDFLGRSGEVLCLLHPRLVERLLRRLLPERVGLDRQLAGLPTAAVGAALASPTLTLWDDPLFRGGDHPQPTDDEGVVGARRLLLDEGRLGFQPSDRASAQRAERTATGHGFRVRVQSEEYLEAPVRTALGYLEAPVGPKARAALVPGKTVWITDLLGLHSANSSTGAFSNAVLGGLAVEDGQPVARFTAGSLAAAGNFFELLLQAEGFSQEQVATGTARLGWLAAPLRLH